MANTIFETTSGGQIGRLINGVSFGGSIRDRGSVPTVRAQRVYSATVVFQAFNLGRTYRYQGYDYRLNTDESFHIKFPLELRGENPRGQRYTVAKNMEWYLDLTHDEYVTHGYGQSFGIPNTYTYDLVRYAVLTPTDAEMEQHFIECIDKLTSINGVNRDEPWWTSEQVPPGFHFVVNQDGTENYEILNMDFSDGDGDRRGPLVPRQIIVDYLPVGALGTPKNATAPSLAAVGGIVISWQPPINGEELEWPTYVTIDKYAIWRAEASGSQIGEYTLIGETTDGETTAWTDMTAEGGHRYYYRIQAECNTYPDYSSRLSEPTGGTYVNAIPGVPVIETGASGRIYNPRPRMLITLGSDPDSTTLDLQTAGWRASRESAAPGSRIVLMRDRAMGAAGTFTATVTETDPVGNAATAEGTGTYAVPTWTDVPIVARQTITKAVHINELRQQLEQLCAYYGLEPPVWASGEVIAGVTSKAGFQQHAGELQNVVRALVDKINTWDPESSRNNVTIPTLIEPQRPLASVINQLRDIIKIL